MPNHIVDAFTSVTNQSVFAAHLQGLMNYIEPKEGVYAASNLFTYQRNLGFFKDEKFVAAATTHIEGAAEEGALWRFAVVAWAARHGLRIPGDFVECTCNRGTAAKIVCDYLDFGNVQKQYFNYDLYQGPAPMSGLNTERIPNAVNCRNKLPDALAQSAPEHIAFMHLDLKTADEEIGVLNALFDRMTPRAVLVLSNYGSLPHAKTQVMETAWFAARGYSVLELPTGQGLVLK